MIDEVRISNIARNESWIKTEYYNQNDTNSFYKIGQKENNPLPIISDPQPSNGESDVSISLSDLSFHIEDPQGELMDYNVK